MGAPKEEKPEYDEFGLLVKPVRGPSASSTEAWVAAVAAAPPPPPPPPPLPPVQPPSEMTASDKTWNTKKMFSEDPADPSSTVGTGGPVSEWSHQQIVRRADTDANPVVPEEPDEWQDMPAFASQDLYDDEGRLIALAAIESESEDGKGGASKGYTRVYDDEDAQSATSMDENTSYLFKESEDDEASRSPLSQMQATKDLLTEGQRIAYVGVCKLAMVEMAAEVGRGGGTGKAVKKELGWAKESMKMWSQKMMVRLYMHMDISPAEQIMIEQLAEHGVMPADLTPTLMNNSRVSNPMAAAPSSSSPRQSTMSPPPPYSQIPTTSTTTTSSSATTGDHNASPVQSPSQLSAQTLDIDIRWTVLCDLFLVLIADSAYDARSRVLLERVGASLGIPWLDICRFEKRVTDALSIQESTEQNWSEREHMENRMKKARNMRFMMMGLATIGGGLVIGLSGGLLAPVIGVGLAAGFTTIGVAGTGSFLAGAGGTALIASGMVVSGATIGGKASYNRTKSVETFEYRPLHNAKRVNLIITVSGWMNGKVDDVRLPYSTVDPIMGDLFSVHWEPEMLTSMGQTINILATEVLTQSLQQLLGSTILVALMASLQLPVVLTKLSYLLDNPWSVSLDRANAAGLILADSLINRNLGVRPVTLVGYSLGARVIFSCLRELQRRRAFGLVQNVYIFGSPVVVKKDEYAKAVSAVSGRFVNGYARNDWILGYLFRATSGGIGRVAGLAPIDDIPAVENVDVTELVDGHMAYRAAIPRLLRHVGFVVLSDEFTEIEDPDPDRHHERQRELISELDDARKELDAATKKPRFAFFGRKGAAAEKKNWETYEDSRPAERSADHNPAADPAVIFDVDAIRAELAREQARTAAGASGVGTGIGTGTGTGTTTLAPPPHVPLRHAKSFGDAAAAGGGGGGSRSAGAPQAYRAASTTRLDSYREDDWNDSDSEDEFGNRRNKRGEEAPTLSFGRAYEPPPRVMSPYLPRVPPVRSSSLQTPYRHAIPEPELPERNVWADDEDEFGEEKEMTMTFA